MMALEDAGLPADHPALVRAGAWLLDEQILAGGDWQVRCSGEPGGWAFEFANDIYPDTDDSAVVMMALDTAAVDPKRKRLALQRGTEWLVSMQSHNGGWGAFDRNNTQAWTRDIPFADFGEMIDPPSADVTAHIIEYLGQIGWAIDRPEIRRALDYLWREQDPDGSWYGRWGVNLIYGVGAVLPALQAIGEDMRSPGVRRAVDWLLCRQNEDGGWGERIGGIRRGGVARTRAVDGVADRVGVDGASRGRGSRSSSHRAWHRVASRDPDRDRRLGRAAVHWDRVPDGFHDQLPPVSGRLPADGARALPPRRRGEVRRGGVGGVGGRP